MSDTWTLGELAERITAGNLQAMARLLNDAGAHIDELDPDPGQQVTRWTLADLTVTRRREPEGRVLRKLLRPPLVPLELPVSPGPWILDQGQIRDTAGNILASIRNDLGDELGQANGLLMAAAPALAEYMFRLCDLLWQAADEAYVPGDEDDSVYRNTVVAARALLDVFAPDEELGTARP
jgi:hypothetical protein